jgi:hypothetical protein
VDLKDLLGRMASLALEEVVRESIRKEVRGLELWAGISLIQSRAVTF